MYAIQGYVCYMDIYVIEWIYKELCFSTSNCIGLFFTLC